MITVGENTYITVLEADTLLQYEFDFDNWYNLTELEKERALVQATRNIDNHFFIGEKYNFEQTLEFPRDIITRKNGDNTYGEVPNNVKLACALEALEIGINKRNELETGIKSKSFSRLSVTYTDTKANENIKLNSKQAKELLKPYIKKVFSRGYYG